MRSREGALSAQEGCTPALRTAPPPARLFGWGTAPQGASAPRRAQQRRSARRSAGVHASQPCLVRASKPRRGALRFRRGGEIRKAFGASIFLCVLMDDAPYRWIEAAIQFFWAALTARSMSSGARQRTQPRRPCPRPAAGIRRCKGALAWGIRAAPDTRAFHPTGRFSAVPDETTTRAM